MLEARDEEQLVQRRRNARIMSKVIWILILMVPAVFFAFPSNWKLLGIAIHDLTAEKKEEPPPERVSAEVIAEALSLDDKLDPADVRLADDLMGFLGSTKPKPGVAAPKPTPSTEKPPEP